MQRCRCIRNTQSKGKNNTCRNNKNDIRVVKQDKRIH